MAESVQAGPRKPVPPRMRMRNGLGAWTAESAAARASGRNGAAARAAAEEARNSRRVTIITANLARCGEGVKRGKGCKWSQGCNALMNVPGRGLILVCGIIRAAF